MTSALIIVGALVASGWTLATQNAENSRGERVAAALMALAFGAGTIYLAEHLNGFLAWITGIGLILLMPFPVWALTHLAFSLLSPIAEDIGPPHKFGVVMIVAATTALMASFATGTHPLPGVALGSPLVLHIERTAAIFAVLLLLFTILVHAWKGTLPSEISSRGVRYADIKDKTENALQKLQEASDSSTKVLRRTRRELKELADRVDQP